MKNILNVKENKILFIIFLFLLFGVVLAFSVRFDSAFVIPKRFFLRTFSLLLFIFVIYFAMKYRPYISRSPMVISAFVFFILSLLSTFFSLNILAGIPYCIDILCCIFIFLIITALFNFDDIKKTVPFLFILAGIVGAYSIVQHLGWDMELFHWQQVDLVKNRSISTLGNPDFLSAFLVMIIPLAFVCAFRDYDEKDRFISIPGTILKMDKGYLYLVFWGFLCLVNIFTYSRAGLMSMALGLLLAVILLGKNVLFRHWKKSICILLILVIAICGVLAMEFSGKTRHSLVKRITAIFQGDNNLTTRIYLWKVALNVVKKNPILGVGPRTFSIAYLPYRYMEPMNIRHRMAAPESAHNLFLDIASFSGLLTFAAFCFFLFLLFCKSLKAIFKAGKTSNNKQLKKSKRNCRRDVLVPIKGERRTENGGRMTDPVSRFSPLASSMWDVPVPTKENHNKQEIIRGDNRIYLIGFIAGLFAYISHHLVSFPTLPDRLLFWVYAGFCFVYFTGGTQCNAGHSRPQSNEENVPRSGGSYKGEKLTPLKWVVLAVAAIFSIFLIYFNTRITLADYYFARAQAYQDIIPRLSKYKSKEKAFVKSIKEYDKVIKLNPIQPRYWMKKGKLFDRFASINLQKEHTTKILEQAIKNYINAIKLNPRDPYPYKHLGLLYSRIGMNDYSEKALKKALEIDPYNVLIITDLALLYDKMKKYDLAETYFKRALEVYPGGEWTLGNMGIFYYNRGKNRRAKEYLEKALEIGPGADKYREYLKKIKKKGE
ncbi:MAG: O-antigen ligase family protein [Candidatus Eremiobacteraeota bacterium]|nr:O-antigen ligase family protein [Candidatus Eremiobacteraeota bacterium]